MTNGGINQWFHHKWAIAFVVYLFVLLAIAAFAYLRLLPPVLYAASAGTLSHFILIGIASYLSYPALNRQTIWVWNVAFPFGPLLVSVVVLVDTVLQGVLPGCTVSVANLAASFSGILLFYRLAKAQLP